MSLPDLIGLAGILVGLGLLIWLAFKGWSVLLLAPLAAIIAAFFSREPLLAHWTQTFMRSAAGFLAQFFPLFLLGALFGKLMEGSGSVTAIADFMTRKLGAKRAILAVVLGGAIVTYGGVSLFVAFFVIAPMAQDLFRTAAIPRRLMPAAIMLGTSTFTMSAMPGTPSIQNTIPMPFFGTTPFAAPGLGVLASLIMLAFGLWWLAREEAAAKRKGEGFGEGPPLPAERLADDEKLRERATTAREFDPAEIAHGKAAVGQPSIAAAATPIVIVILVNLVLSLIILPRVDLGFLANTRVGRRHRRRRRRRMVGDDRALLRDRDGARAQPPSHSGPARDHGRGRQCFRAAGHQRREPGRVRRRGRGDAGLRGRAGRRAGRRRRAAGVSCRRHQHARGSDWLRLRRVDDCARCARRHLPRAGSSNRNRSRAPSPCRGNRVGNARQPASQRRCGHAAFRVRVDA